MKVFPTDHINFILHYSVLNVPFDGAFSLSNRKACKHTLVLLTIDKKTSINTRAAGISQLIH